jgi:hypothetical protein
MDGSENTVREQQPTGGSNEPNMESTQDREWPWGCTAAALIFLGIGIWFFYSSSESRHQADAARVAEPIRLNVDLSKPGTYSGELRHTFTFACADYFQIVPESPFASREEAESSLKGLVAHYSLIGPHGGVVHERDCEPTGFRAAEVKGNRWVPSLGRDHFGCEKGVYTLKFTVEHGASKLAGIPHVLVARYAICGIEYLPSHFLQLLGIAGCVIGGFFAVAVVVIRRKRASSPPPSETASNDRIARAVASIVKPGKPGNISQVRRMTCKP